MSFLDFLTGKIKCPRCGKGGAKQIDGAIYCSNPACAYFSPALGKSDAAEALPTVDSREPVSVPTGTLAIQYRNFRGVEKTFVGQAGSAHRVNNHISVKVAPKNNRISLARSRILNLREVEAAFPQRVEPHQDWPTAKERQVLAYHKKHRSTSPLFERISAKYPNWHRAES